MSVHIGGEVSPGAEARRAELEHLVRTEDAPRFARRHGRPVRPAWQSRWRRFLHNVGSCEKQRAGYTCHARSKEECP